MKEEKIWRNEDEGTRKEVLVPDWRKKVGYKKRGKS